MKTDCFAWNKDKCNVLIKMVCLNGECSFYKTAAQVQLGRQKAEKRLKDIGWVKPSEKLNMKEILTEFR